MELPDRTAREGPAERRSGLMGAGEWERVAVEANDRKVRGLGISGHVLQVDAELP
jgi:hypothetical protein